MDAFEREGEQWHLSGTLEAGGFDAAVVAIPAEQAGPLLKPFQAKFASAAARARSAPCWTAMVASVDRIDTERTMLRDAGPIGWAVRDGGKPGRDGTETWVVQASPEWSTQYHEVSPEEIATTLLRLLETALGVPLPRPIHLAAHRWRYARSGGAGKPGALWDTATRIGACGDWLLAPRIEAAWLSGRHLAALIG